MDSKAKMGRADAIKDLLSRSVLARNLPLSLDNKMENPGGVVRDAEGFITSQNWRVSLTVLLVAAIYKRLA